MASRGCLPTECRESRPHCRDPASDDEADTISNESRSSLCGLMKVSNGDKAADRISHSGDPVGALPPVGSPGEAHTPSDCDDADSDWSGSASELSDAEDGDSEAAVSGTDPRFPRHRSWESAHFASLRAKWCSGADLTTGLLRPDSALDTAGILEIIGVPTLMRHTPDHRAELPVSLPPEAQCLVLYLLGRAVGYAEVWDVADGPSIFPLVHSVTLHPDFQDTHGLFASASLIDALLHAIHRRFLHDPRPCLFVTPILPSEVAVALGRHGYVAYGHRPDAATAPAHIFIYRSEACQPPPPPPLPLLNALSYRMSLRTGERSPGAFGPRAVKFSPHPDCILILPAVEEDDAQSEA